MEQGPQGFFDHSYRIDVVDSLAIQGEIGSQIDLYLLLHTDVVTTLAEVAAEADFFHTTGYALSAQDPETGEPIDVTFALEGACPWDVDGSGDTGITDFLALLAAWGTDPGGPPDFDGDGVVGIGDFLELLANWGPCP